MALEKIPGWMGRQGNLLLTQSAYNDNVIIVY